MLINTEPRPPLFKRAAPVLPFFCCIAVFLLTLLAIKAVWVIGPWLLEESKPVDWPAIGIALTASLCFTAVLMLSERTGVLSLPRILQFFFIILFLTAAANLIWRFSDLLAYGDSKHFTKYLRNNQVFPRWFLGTAIMTWLYRFLWMPLGAHLPETLSFGDGFIRISGAAVMCVSSFAYLRAHGNRLALLVPLLTPIWLMFCSGYNEYYPFIAFVYVGFLFVISNGLAKRSPVFVAATSSLLFLSYTAFVPLGFLLIACYGLSTSIKKALAAVLIAGLICVSAIILLWPEALTSFASEYRDALNLGEKNTHYAAYIGRSAGDTTPFFKLSYALSIEHILHLCFMFFFSTGVVPVFLLAAALIGYFKKGFLTEFARTKVVIFLGSCLVFQLCYFVLLIPKLGPVKDIDLFFSVYLTVGFAAGFVGDRFLDSMSVETRDIWRNCVVGSCIGSSAVILVHLLWIGILPS